jgi:hypothetical protein
MKANDPSRRRAIEKQAEYLRDNMNGAETKVKNWLIWAGVKFTAQKPIYLDGYPFILDFAITRNGKIIGAIEVNGYFHNLNRQERDFNLSCAIPYPLLFIDASDCYRAGKAVRAKIASFLDEHKLRD